MCNPGSADARVVAVDAGRIELAPSTHGRIQVTTTWR
jgi:hypothetical protein